jgi:hypothetical protein
METPAKKSFRKICDKKANKRIKINSTDFELWLFKIGTKLNNFFVLFKNRE